MQTGSAILPDIGTLAYNGVEFNQLYTSTVNGVAVPDAAGRTVKYMEYTIAVDGYVTLDDSIGEDTVDQAWMQLRKKLDAQGGVLAYTGKGFGDPFVVNQPGGRLRDVKWGPIPKTLEFTPLGASRSAKIRWTVTTCIPEYDRIRGGQSGVLQFNEETSVSYDPERYTSITIKGVLEIALTRTTQGDRTVPTTVDAYRSRLNRITDGFDLTRFRVTKTDMHYSRDRRTLDWEFGLEELPPMRLPAGIISANGHFTVKPEKNAGLQGMVKWVCTLACSYVVPKESPRRLAWEAFVAMWVYRMMQSEAGSVPANANVEVQQGGIPGQGVAQLAPNGQLQPNGQLGPNIAQVQAAQVAQLNKQKALPISLTIDEGLYLDSKEISFTATWQLFTRISHLLLAAGIWRNIPSNANTWGASIRSISGSSSWLQNELDPNADVIVDFGS